MSTHHVDGLSPARTHFSISTDSSIDSDTRHAYGLSPTRTHFSISTDSHFDSDTPHENEIVISQCAEICPTEPVLTFNGCFTCHDLIARMCAASEDEFLDANLQLDVLDHFQFHDPTVPMDAQFCGYGRLMPAAFERVEHISGAEDVLMLDVQDRCCEQERMGIDVDVLRDFDMEEDVGTMESGTLFDFDQFIATDADATLQDHAHGTDDADESLPCEQVLDPTDTSEHHVTFNPEANAFNPEVDTLRPAAQTPEPDADVSYPPSATMSNPPSPSADPFPPLYPSDSISQTGAWISNRALIASTSPINAKFAVYINTSLSSTTLNFSDISSASHENEKWALGFDKRVMARAKAAPWAYLRMLDKEGKGRGGEGGRRAVKRLFVEEWIKAVGAAREEG